MNMSKNMNVRRRFSTVGNNNSKIQKWKDGQLFWYQFIVLQLFGVDPVWVVDGAIDLANTDTLGAKPVQVSHGVKTHITKALWEDK